MPLISTEMRFPSGLKSGQFRADLDFILDVDAPGVLRLSFKDAEKRIHAGDVMINRDAVKVAGRNVAGGYPPHAGHPNSAQMAPFYTARMPVDQYSLAEAMKANGDVTAHSGKWHISKHHYDYPTPFYHGFDQSTHDRGVQCTMKPDRLTGFATTDPKNPYRLDENGMPFDVPQDAALNFI